MSRGGRRIKWGSEPTTTTNLDGIWGLNEINNLIGQNKWPRGPNAPTGLSATAGNAELSLSWTAPATTHGTITNYLVEYTPSGGSASYVLTGSTSTSYTLTGLTNGTSYTVRVAAVNFTTGDYSGTATGTPLTSTVTLLRGLQADGTTQYGAQHVSGSGTAADPFVVNGGTHDTINYNPMFFVSGTATMHIQVPVRLWDDDGTSVQTRVTLRAGNTIASISSSRTAGTSILNSAGVGTHTVTVTNQFVRYSRVDSGEYPGEWVGLRIWFTGAAVIP